MRERVEREKRTIESDERYGERERDRETETEREREVTRREKFRKERVEYKSKVGRGRDKRYIKRRVEREKRRG